MITQQMIVRDLVNDALGAAGVFRRHKIDYYRIGHLTLAEAAARGGVDPEVLIEALSVLSRNPARAPSRPRDLIAYLRQHYHNAHHNQMLHALRLAWRVESEQADHQHCPVGLGKLLNIMSESLEAHQLEEDEILFPAMLHSPRHNLRFPIMRMIAEHDEMSDHLDTMARLMNDYVVPEGANGDWCTLIKICDRLDSQLRFHMHLENNLLFPRFMGERAVA